jgi:predicted nucleotidyltransferase
MTISVDEQQDEIAAACRQYGIERLFVFGSAIREDFRPGESDIDLLVEFGPIDVTKKFHVYLDAREAFRRIFNADVDLVMRGAGLPKSVIKPCSAVWSPPLPVPASP